MSLVRDGPTLGLLRDRKEERDVAAYNPWVADPAVRIVGQLEAYPPIKLGTPAPYTPSLGSALGNPKSPQEADAVSSLGRMERSGWCCRGKGTSVILVLNQYKCIGCSPGKHPDTRTRATGSDDDSRDSVQGRC